MNKTNIWWGAEDTLATMAQVISTAVEPKPVRVGPTIEVVYTLTDKVEQLAGLIHYHSYIVKEWADEFELSAYRLDQLMSNYSYLTLKAMIKHSIKPEQQMAQWLDCITRAGRDITLYWTANAEDVKQAPRELVSSLVDQLCDRAGKDDAKTIRLCYRILRYSTKSTEHRYVREVARMKGHRRIFTTDGGKLFRIAQQYPDHIV